MTAWRRNSCMGRCSVIRRWPARSDWGSLANRDEILGLLANLPQAVPATHTEVMSYVATHRLFGLSIGYVDAHLLASAS
jgi:hypothetical protein